jgi:hypothetical protein
VPQNQECKFSIKNSKAIATIQVLYKSTSCLAHSCRCDDDRIFPNRLDPLDRILSNLFDGLT